MGNYQGYQKYKDSGVEWLGDIPEHWEVKRLRYIGKFINGFSFNSNAFTKIGVRVLKISNIQHMRIDWSDSSFIDEEYYETASTFRVYKNDLVFALTRPIISTGIKAALIDTNEKILINQRNCIFRTQQEMSNKWIYYILLCSSFIKEFDLRIDRTGQQPNISSNDIANIYIPISPLNEQEKIAQFLDYKTKQIDELIKKKETLIEKLDEKRTAIISHAVTKGLDSSVPMKDSGIEWLGDIPKHWRRGKLNYFCKSISGGTPDRNNPDFWEGNIPWVKTGEVNYQNIYSAEEYITKEGLNSSSTTLVKPETLLMAMYGQGNTRGRVAILKIEAAFNQACLAISPLNNLNVYFLYYYLISAYKYIRDTGNESSQMNLSAGIIGKINILVPNLEEQQKIVQYLDHKTTQIDQQKAKIKEAIELLKEYRTSLITNAVTGKIDVSQIAIPSPQKPQPQKG
jgi:type I restriction enzyme S subunit